MIPNDTDPIERVRAELSDGFVVSRVAYEGPELVVRIETPERFAAWDDSIRALV